MKTGFVTADKQHWAPPTALCYFIVNIKSFGKNAPLIK
jgi:hypothetical protein